MAGNKKRFRDAYKNWHELQHFACFSVPRAVGKVAILCSYAADIDKPHVARKDQLIFRKEALNITDSFLAQGRDVELALNCKDNDVVAVLRDESISDVVTSGHGTISSLELPDDSIFDWEDVAAEATHLKTGAFIQRQCGAFADLALPAPMGLFAVNDARNVFAAWGENFRPRGLYHPANRLVRPVFTESETTYEEIKNFEPRYIHKMLNEGPFNPLVTYMLATMVEGI